MLADIATPAVPAARTSAPAATAAPSADRLPALDVLRGLALAFMILVHFHQLLRVEEMTGFQDVIAWGIWILVEEKAWGTFALLFGAGIALLDRRLEARGLPVKRVLARRLLVLFGLGIAMKQTMGFSILELYGWWGLALVAMRSCSTRSLLGVAIASAMARPLIAALWGVYAWYARIPPAWPTWLGETLTWVLPDTNLPLMILGALAVRLGVVDDPRRHARLIARWIAFGVVACALWWLLSAIVPAKLAIPQLAWSARSVVGLVNQQWLCIAYAGGALLLLAARPALCERLAFLGAAGRMAFTNYLLQAILVWILWKPLGVRMGAYAYVASAAALVAVLVLFSTAWLRRFRTGPFEWLWRMATYARVEPLRRARVVLVVATLVAVLLAARMPEPLPRHASRDGSAAVVAELLSSAIGGFPVPLYADEDEEHMEPVPPWRHAPAFLLLQLRTWLAWLIPDGAGWVLTIVVR
jgi:uncharacterized protein